MEDNNILNEKLIEEEKVDPVIIEDEPLDISDEAEKVDEDLKKIAHVSEDESLKARSANKKWLIALLFLMFNLISILVTAVMEFAGEDQPINLSEVWNAFNSNWAWGVGAIGLVVLIIGFESLKRFILLKTTLKKSLPIVSLSAVIISKYYDNVTPLGAGGQPFEIFYLRKKGLPIGIASSVPLVSYSLNKVAYVLVSFAFIILYGFENVTTFIKTLCLIGLFVNLLIPVAIIMFAFMPKFGSAIARFVSRVGKKIRLVKNEEEFYGKITGSFIEYGECITYFIKKSKLSILISFICSLCYFIALYSIPYFTVRLSGNHNIHWGQMVNYCVICYASITLLPTPGNAGGAELSFRSIFESYLSGGLLFWGMLSWRILSYYTFIVFGLILIILQHVRRFIKLRKDKKAPVPKVEVAPEDELEPYSPIPPTVPTAEDDINTAVPLSVAEATLEPDLEEAVEPEEIVEGHTQSFDTVMEFTAVIESKSTVTITEEHLEVHEVQNEEPHQITLDELVSSEEKAEPSDEEPAEEDNLTVTQEPEVLSVKDICTHEDQNTNGQITDQSSNPTGEDEDPID